MAGKLGSMTTIKRSVAVVVRGPEAGTFLVVRRPDDPADPLAGVWGFPAVTLADGADERAGVIRAGRDKLGVTLAPGERIGQAGADRGAYRLMLADYEATVVDGVPSVPQPDTSVTQYVEWRYTNDPRDLDEAAGRGSLCAQVFLEANGKNGKPVLTPPASSLSACHGELGGIPRCRLLCRLSVTVGNRRSSNWSRPCLSVLDRGRRSVAAYRYMT